jgi:glycosyltransferase involved in cell wall biosynthesis/SAM-dependent methyltransferase
MIDGRLGEYRGALVTIAIPYFKMDTFLFECLNSLIAQTMPAWEAFIVDDCSPGRRVDWIVASYNDPRLHYIRHNTNRGAGAGRNTGIQAGHAPFVLYIDADDFVHPEFLAATLDAIDKQGADCAYSDFQFVGLSNEVWRPEPASANELAEAQWIPGPGTVMRRTVWEQVGGYSAELYPNDDWDFWIGAIELGFSVVRVPRLLYFYRRHAQAGMFTLGRSEWISREAILKKRAEFFAIGDRAKRFRAGGLLSSAHASRIAGDRRQSILLTARAVSVEPKLLFTGTKSAVRRSLSLARKVKKRMRLIARKTRELFGSTGKQEINLPPLDWDWQAPILHNRYGHLSHDFPVLGHVIDKIKARSVLEIGCGSGRLVPVYLTHNVQTIWLQDVSERALELCRQRFFCQKHIRYFHGNVQSVPISAAPDLIVANRVLQHVIEDREFKEMLNYLTSMTRYFYLNEAGIDEARSINWLYLKGRDYIQIFRDLGCRLVEQDELTADTGRQRWMLFSKRERTGDTTRRNG